MASINQSQQTGSNPETVKNPTTELKVAFPYDNEKQRLLNYSYFEQLFLGDHYEAFNLRAEDGQFHKQYAKLRYVMINFAGLVSKICADMLFSEQVTLKMPEGGDQKYTEGLWTENNLDVQLYESALGNSYNGDAVFKVRVGKRHPNDKKSTVIIEDITPRIYFPKIDPFNVRAEPTQKELAWVFTRSTDQYLRKEIHEPGKIINKVYKMDKGIIGEEVSLDILGIPGLTPEQSTKIDQSLIVHIPNWKVGSKWNGFSDYYDLDSIFFAINNRMTKVDNVLDKHTDPILMVPPGVLNENGTVRKKALGVIEIGEGETGKPEYIVWDASLDNAFKEIEKLVEFLYMIGEVSPDVLGLGEGVSDSGRALKFKLMRTIAKVARKKLYYYRAIQDIMLIAQKMGKAWGIEVEGQLLSGEPAKPDLTFADGLPIDDSELIDTESKAIDAGITSKKDSMMRVYNLDEKVADQRLKDIEAEKPKIEIPSMDLGNQNKQKPPGKTDQPGK